MTLLSRIFDFLFGWIFRKRNAEPLLLDVGLLPNRWFFRITGIFYLIMYLLTLYDHVYRYERNQLSVIVWVFMGVFFTTLSFSKVQIYQGGIWTSAILIPWAKIESTEWRDGRSYNLEIQGRGWLPAFMRRWAIPVPIEKRAEVEALLEQFLQK
jgi:hypothetical protein